jgi:hypothetical protein
MKAALVIFAIALTASAEVVTTHDSRTNGTPFSSRIQSVDIGVTDTQKNPDFQLWLRNIEAPALADLNTRMIVKITGTVAQARADLRTADDARRPEKMTLKTALAGSTIKAKRRALRDAMEAAGTDQQYRRAARRLDEFNELVEAKRDEDVSLNITKEDAP